MVLLKAEILVNENQYQSDIMPPPRNSPDTSVKSCPLTASKQDYRASIGRIDRGSTGVGDMGGEKSRFFDGSWSQIYSIQRSFRSATARDPL